MLVVDYRDENLVCQIEEMGIMPLVTSTIMETEEDKVVLAKEILALVE